MQQENVSVNADPAPISAISSLSADRRCSLLPLPVDCDGEFANVCDSLFTPSASSPFPISAPLSSANPQNPYKNDQEKLANLTFQYQEILYQYELCRTHLEEAVEEAEALRLQNANLRIANAELASRLSLISPYNSPDENLCALPEAFAGFPLNILNDFQRLDLNSNRPKDSRTTLPKSISIRSKGYMKLAASNRHGRNRFHDPPILSPQKVFVPLEGDEGLKQETETPSLEFDAYPQGMLKTELCNKWQETGACPYGEQCQFAHGVSELRPVIRHPRYKTEICRMILSGGTCPYGHRCHFRHALSPQDKFLLSPLN